MSRGSSIHIDAHELRDLQLDMSKAPVRIRNPKGVRDGAKVIKTEMKIGSAGHTGSFFTPRKRHKKPTNLPRYVSYEMTGPLSAEIGVESRGAGALAHFIAYGSPKYPIGHWDVGADVRRAEPRVMGALADQAEESVLGKGGGH